MDINKLMNIEGPIVKCILISPNPDNDLKPNIEQIEIDMTPRKDVLSEILGSGKTFIGQYEEDDDITVVAMTSLNSTHIREELKYRLQPPLNNEKIYDKVILIRMKWNSSSDAPGGGESIPIDLTYDSYLNCSFNLSID